MKNTIFRNILYPFPVNDNKLQTIILSYINNLSLRIKTTVSLQSPQN